MHYPRQRHGGSKVLKLLSLKFFIMMGKVLIRELSRVDCLTTSR